MFYCLSNALILLQTELLCWVVVRIETLFDIQEMVY